MGFSFDLEENGPERRAADPEIRRIDAPRFSASVSRVRPELDSEPEGPVSHATLDQADDEPPLDLPEGLMSKQPERADPLRPRELLGTIRKALRAGGPQRPLSRAAETQAPPRMDRRLGDTPAHGRQTGKRLLGPLAAAAALGLTYLISTSSLVALGPRLARSSPRVPELGSVGTKPKPSESPLSSTAPPAKPEPPKETKPLIESGPLPEGLSYPGKGLIEIVTSERELIYVDSIFLGRGPLRRVPVLPGEHAIKIRSGGTERDASAVVRTAETTRVHFETDAHLVETDGKKADPEELD